MAMALCAGSCSVPTTVRHADVSTPCALQVQQLQEQLQTAEAAAASAARDGSGNGAAELQRAHAEADAQRQRCENLQQVCRLAALPKSQCRVHRLMVQAN